MKLIHKIAVVVMVLLNTSVFAQETGTFNLQVSQESSSTFNLDISLGKSITQTRVIELYFYDTQHELICMKSANLNVKDNRYFLFYEGVESSSTTNQILPTKSKDDDIQIQAKNKRLSPCHKPIRIRMILT